MADFAVARLRVGRWACLIMLPALVLGIAYPTNLANASCVGPQVLLRQKGEPLTPRREGKGEREKVVYDVDRTFRLTVNGSNLTFDCADGDYGCLGPEYSDDPLEPMRDVILVLRQKEREWELAEIGDIGPDLKAEVAVRLPAGVRPGPAVLELLDSQAGHGAHLDLDIT